MRTNSQSWSQRDHQALGGRPVSAMCGPVGRLIKCRPKVGQAEGPLEPFGAARSKLRLACPPRWNATQRSAPFCFRPLLIRRLAFTMGCQEVEPQRPKSRW